jgi:hypothetical protein
MSGSYTLTTTHSSGCTATATTSVTVNSLPQGSLSANGPFCSSGSGQLTWTATSGTGPYTVVYNDGTANRIVSDVVSGTAFAVFTTPVNSNTTYTLVSVTDNNSCSRTSGFTTSSATITVNSNPSVPTGTATQIFCSTSSPTVTELSPTGTSIQWYEASSGGSALATNTSLVDSTIYYATQTVSGCESTTRLAVTASVVSSGTWLGNTSTDWNTSANWCGGIPTSSTNVVINSGASNFPNLSTGADGFANSVTINSGGSLTMGGSETLTITAGGSFTNSGTFTAGSCTAVAIAATGSVTGTVAFNNVTASGTAKASIRVF